MKEQYVGDINDNRKYALLRRLADGGRVTIVCWMLTPPDNRPNGGNTGYLKKPERWRPFDPPLFDLLKWIIADPSRRRVALIEEQGIIPGAKYASEVLSDDASERRAYFELARETLSGADLIFFDPDNGLAVPSTPIGRRHSSNFVYLDEMEAFHGSGHSVLVYQHFTRERRGEFIARRVEDLGRVAPDAEIRPIITPHVMFLLVRSPKHPQLQLGQFPEPPLFW